MTKKRKCNLFAACKKRIAITCNTPMMRKNLESLPFAPHHFLRRKWQLAEVIHAFHLPCVALPRQPGGHHYQHHRHFTSWNPHCGTHVSNFSLHLRLWKNFNPQFQTQNFCGTRHLLTWIDIGSNCHDWSRHPSLKGWSPKFRPGHQKQSFTWSGNTIKCHEMINMPL